MGRISVFRQQEVEKRGTTKTTRNDYYGEENGTRIKIERERGREVCWWSCDKNSTYVRIGQGAFS
jgi:hypothetical protein